MDISNWSMERIMQLPADCFGRRWPIIFCDQVVASATKYESSKLALPDRCVIWGIDFATYTAAVSGLTGNMAYAFKLGSEVVTTDAQFIALMDVFPGSPEIVDGVEILRGPNVLSDLKLCIPAQGKRLVLRAKNFFSSTLRYTITVVISSVPTEIPDLYAGFPEEKFDEMIRLLRIGVKIR